MTLFSIFWAYQYRNRFPARLPPNLLCLAVYLLFAGASIFWSFNPNVSAIRFAQQAMIVVSIVLPALLAAPTADTIHGMFLLCFAPAAILNVFFVFGNSPLVVAELKGFPGFFGGKNYLGEFAAIPFLLGLHELFFPGARRALGVVAVAVAAWLLFWANSKTAIAFALLAPALAAITIVARRITRLSPAIVLLSIPLAFVVLGTVSHFGLERIGYAVYGDSSLTGRTVIWDFANFEIARRPLLGWGYQSFWLAGPDAPSIVDAPGWVKTMPEGHSGYVDTKLELGYVGYVLLITFILTTLHGVGRMADQAPTRAWIVLSLLLYVIGHNYLESLWMRGSEFLWIVFLIVTAEVARYWRPYRLRRVAYPPAQSLRSSSRYSIGRLPSTPGGSR